jgi:integrase
MARGTTNEMMVKKPRRGKGEGSITQLPDGRWMARIDLGYVNGKRARKPIYGKTRKEAADKLNAALVEKARGTLVVNERQTIGDFLTGWLQDSVKPSVRPKTYVSYEYMCRLHIIPSLGRHPLVKLAPAHVQVWMKEKREAGLSPRTVAYGRVVLRRALGQALKWGLVARNVASLVDPPRTERAEIQPLTPTQARAFLESVAEHRWSALFTVAIALGLREGEALGLSWSDVELDAKTLTVRRQLQRIEKRLQLVEPKTAKSRRTIAMPQVVVDRLREHRVRQLEERLAAGEAWEDNGLVFTSRYGTPVHPENMGRTLRPLLAKAGCPPQRFHDLRHACASLLFAQGLGPKAVMETLGHAQIATTADLYGHMYAELRQEVADRMDAILSAMD